MVKACRQETSKNCLNFMLNMKQQFCEPDTKLNTRTQCWKRRDKNATRTSVVNNAMIIFNKITRCNDLISKLRKLTDKIVLMLAVPVCMTTSKEEFFVHNSMHQRYWKIFAMTECRMNTIPRGDIVCLLVKQIFLIRINMIRSPCRSCKNQRQCWR